MCENSRHHWLEEVATGLPLVTASVLNASMPRCPDADGWALYLSDALRWGGITKSREIALFLAHAGHESSDLNMLEESLWYSAKRLNEVWPRRYPTIAAAAPYAGNPEALANHTYGGRMGNTQPGDGWRFIGRGVLQLTGRYNYSQCAAATGLTLLDNPERLASDRRYAALSAVWYWRDRVTPGGNIESTTRQVNGGTHGLRDRSERFDRTLAAMERMPA